MNEKIMLPVGSDTFGWNDPCTGKIRLALNLSNVITGPDKSVFIWNFLHALKIIHEQQS